MREPRSARCTRLGSWCASSQRPLCRRLPGSSGSPSGGIFVFWLSASVLIAAACVLPFVGRSHRRLDVRPALVLIAICLGLLLGLASWWTPFGWTSYGPRLSLPWILPLVLMSLV